MTLDYRPTLQIYDIIHSLNSSIEPKYILYSVKMYYYMKKLWVCVLVLMLVFGAVIPTVSSGTNDTNGFPYPGDDWAWRMVGAPYAHQLGEYGDDVLVAVMDTGIDYNHPDLKDRMWEGIGYDFVNNNNDPMDNDGHGTHVAGIVASVAPNARLMALKVMEEEGGRWVEVAQAIKYARDNGADIITMSFGGEQSPMARPTQIQMNFAYQQGILMVGAAGNYDADRKHYPAANDNVIAVSAVDSNMEKASYSNYGDWIELAAPGGDSGARIISTVLDNDYGNKMGTSMACPFVTGVAALMMGANPGMSNVEVREALREQAIDLGEPGKDPIYGYGLVNAYRAVGGRVPTPPRALTTMGRDRRVELSWEIPWDQGVSSIEGYRIYRGTSMANIDHYVSTDNLSYTDRNVVNERRYYYYVTAFSSEGESFPSETVMAVPREAPVIPSQPRDPETVMIKNGVRLTWEPPGDNGGESIVGYRIYRDDREITQTDSTEYVDSDIKAGNTYTYKVTALNAVGEGPPSAESTVTVPDDFQGTENGEIFPVFSSWFLPLLILSIVGIFVVGTVYYVIKKRG